MRKKFSILKLLLGLVVLVAGGLLALPLMVDFEGYKEDIRQAIAASTGQRVVIRGGIEGHFIPFPVIVASDVYLSGEPVSGDKDPALTTIKALEARLDIFALIAGETKINAITLVKPNMSSKNLFSIYRNWLSAGEISEDVSSSIDLKEIIIDRGVLYSRNDEDYSVRKIEEIGAIVSIGSLTGPFVVEGNFKTNGNMFAFDANIAAAEDGKEGNADSLWNFYGDGFGIAFSGDFIEDNGSSVLKGKVTAKADDLEFVVNKYFYDKKVEPKVDKDKDEEDATANTTPFLVEGELTYTKKLITLHNIAVNSPAAEGKGDITVLIEADVPQLDISMMFDQINLDMFMLEEAVLETESKESDVISAQSFIEEQRDSEGIYEKISKVIGNLFHNINVLSDISIKEITYKKDSTKQLVLNADMFRGDLVIHQLTALLPGDTLTEINGTIKHNNIRPRFMGEILISGNNFRRFIGWVGIDVSYVPKGLLGKFKANGDITLLPQKIHLSDIEFSVDETQASGSIMIHEGVETSKITSALHINNLDFDRYEIADRASNFLKKYYYGEEGNRYSQRFSWLRSHSGHFLSEIFLEHFKLNNQVFNDAALMVTLNPGSLKVNSFSVNSAILDMAATAQIDITGLRPIINVKVVGKHIDTVAFGYKAPVKSAKTFSWSETPFNFLGLERFDGKLSIKSDTVKHGKIELENMIFSSTLEEGLMMLKKVSADIGKGGISAKGTLIIQGEPILSLSLALNNLKIAPLFDIFSDLNAFSGYISLSGSIATRGENLAKWIKNMASSATLAARAVDVRGFALHHFIENSESLTTAAQVKKLQEKSANTGRTQFSSIDGTFSIKAGTLEIPRFQVSTSRTRGILTGAVDLARWTMHLIGQFAYITVQGSKTITLGYDVKGAVYKPERALNVAQFLQYKGISALPEETDDRRRRRRN